MRLVLAALALVGRPRRPGWTDETIRSDDRLKATIERHEIVAECGGAAVIIGLVIEVVLTWLFFEDHTAVGRWGPVVADVLVTLGVAVEVLFARLARSQSGELQRRSEEKVATANLKAQEAAREAAEARERTSEIERLTAWRRIDLEKQKRIAADISSKATAIDVLIQYQRSDPEAYVFARDIMNIFHLAGIKNVRFGSNEFMSGHVFGLAISSVSNYFTSELTVSFNRESITYFSMPLDLDKFLMVTERAPNLYIFVAPKVTM